MSPAPATTRKFAAPWPTPTPHSSDTNVLRKQLERRNSRRRPAKRQNPPQFCNVDNSKLSCYPTAGTNVTQDTWTRFVWNNRHPDFTQSNLVDVYLFHGDSDELANSWISLPNQIGSLGVNVNDTWFGDRGGDWKGQPIPFPMYWVILRHGQNPDTDARPSMQPIFNAIQTALPNSILASQSSSSSLAAASSASVDAASRSRTAQPTNALQPTGGVTNDFPRWAIALVSVLGFLALAFFILFLFLALRHLREQKQRKRALARRNSMGSESPMMRNDPLSATSPQSPVMGISATGAPASIGHHTAPGRRASSLASPDGASTVSGDAGLSNADATIISDAFRNALRRPDFADRPLEEDESPDDGDQKKIMDRELAEEGRDLRSVSSSKGVRVDTADDDVETVQDHGRRP